MKMPQHSYTSCIARGDTHPHKGRVGLFRAEKLIYLYFVSVRQMVQL